MSPSIYTYSYTHTHVNAAYYEYMYICSSRECVSVYGKEGWVWWVVVVKMGWPGTPISSPVKTYELGIAGGSEGKEYLIAEQEGFNKYKNDQQRVRNGGRPTGEVCWYTETIGTVEDAADDENEIFGYNFLCKQKLAKFLELAICYIYRRYGEYVYVLFASL